MESANEDGGGQDLRNRVDAEATSKVTALNLIRRQSSYVKDNLRSSSETNVDYTRVHIDRSTTLYDKDTITACELLDKAMILRKKWQDNMSIVDPDEVADRDSGSLPDLDMYS